MEEKKKLSKKEIVAITLFLCAFAVFVFVTVMQPKSYLIFHGYDVKDVTFTRVKLEKREPKERYKASRSILDEDGNSYEYWDVYSTSTGVVIDVVPVAE